MQSPEPTSPYPPRYWWLKRLALAGVATAVAVVASRLWWGHYAQQRFDAFVAAKHARGEPVFAADLQPPTVPDDRNAAFYYGRAIAAMDPNADPPAASAGNFPDYLPYHPKWHELARNAVAANARVYGDVRRARDLVDVDWRHQFASPLINFTGSYNGSRNLANLLADSAVYRHLNGDDAEALELIADGRALGRAREQGAFLTGHLVGLGIDAAMVYRVQIIAGGLRVAGLSPPATQPTDRPATRQQVTALIAYLLDDAPYRAARAKVMRGESVYLTDTVAHVTRGSRAMRPLHQLDTVQMDALLQPFVGVVETPVLSTMPPVTAPPTPTLGTAATAAHTVQVRRVYPRIARTNLQIILDRRMAAVALATRLYYLEQGTYPPSLDALVPKYLPSVPIDPFAANGGPIRYVLATGNGQPRPIAYSVGENGADETAGGTLPLPATTQWGWQGGAADQWRDLSQWMPAAPPPGYNDPMGDAQRSTQTGQQQ